MKVICRAQRTGKTEELIRECAAERDAYMVCINHEEAHRVFMQAQGMGLKIPFPLNAHEFLNGQYYGHGIKIFFIDNADLLLEGVTNVPIEAISVTGGGE